MPHSKILYQLYQRTRTEENTLYVCVPCGMLLGFPAGGFLSLGPAESWVRGGNSRIAEVGHQQNPFREADIGNRMSRVSRMNSRIIIGGSVN